MIYFTADLHLYDEKIARMRFFNSVENYHQTLVSNWNRIVKPDDLVYILGDITMTDPGRAARMIKHTLKGYKVILMGNHDTGTLYEELNNLLDDDINCVLKGCSVDSDLGTPGEPFRVICTHMPVHPDELQWYKGNIHGHIHHVYPPYYVPISMPSPKDPRYFNVNLEFHGYEPMSLDEIKQHFEPSQK